MSFYNDDYDAPWNTVNERSSVNDVTDEVWNDPMHRDDPCAPWNTVNERSSVNGVTDEVLERPSSQGRSFCALERTDVG